MVPAAGAVLFSLISAKAQAVPPAFHSPVPLSCGSSPCDLPYRIYSVQREPRGCPSVSGREKTCSTQDYNPSELPASPHGILS